MDTKEYIECKPVMLPWSGEMPDSYEDFRLLAKENPMHQWGPSDPHIQLGTVWLTNQLLMNKMGYIPQQLYLVSDEEILVGEWAYDAVVRDIFTAPTNIKITPGHGGKIIATTDKSLGLPLIPESFIKLYVEKNGEIDRVRLKCHQLKPTTLTMDEIRTGLKLTDQSEVIILPIEDKMYTEKQVLTLMAITVQKINSGKYAHMSVFYPVARSIFEEEGYKITQNEMYSRDKVAKFHQEYMDFLLDNFDKPLIKTDFNKWFDKTYPI